MVDIKSDFNEEKKQYGEQQSDKDVFIAEQKPADSKREAGLRENEPLSRSSISQGSNFAPVSSSLETTSASDHYNRDYPTPQNDPTTSNPEGKRASDTVARLDGVETTTTISSN